jgi:Tol biopolymer transport system component
VKTTAQVFLSYAREDAEKVKRLYQKLSDAGFKPWMDKKDILPGERWQSSIWKAIRGSDFFLVCLSANSVDRRGWIQREIKQALDIWQEKLEDDIYLIPVRLEDCEVPESLRDFQWVNLFEENGWTRLVKAIQVGMKRRKASADKERVQPVLAPARRLPVSHIGAIVGVIVLLFIALSTWLVPDVDSLFSWLSKTPTVTPTNSLTHAPVTSTAIPTFTPPPTRTPVLPTDTPMPIPPTPTPTPTDTPVPLTATSLGGGRIAFVSNRDDPDPTNCLPFNCNDEIYVMNADGSEVTPLTNEPGYDYYPSWSPDGTRIAFQSYHNNDDIYVMNADGSGVARLTDHPANDWLSSWSPDGKRIAFDSKRDANDDIYVMNADGSEVERLTNNPSWDEAPSWSPNGMRIAFASTRNDTNPVDCDRCNATTQASCNYEIYVMNADGSDQTRLTNNPAPECYPSWSPDGKHIAYTAESNGNWDIYVMNADGSGVERLTNNPGRDEAPSWSPDGMRIAFTRREKDTNGDGHIDLRDPGEIYVMDTESRRETNLTNNPANDYAPSWTTR